MAPKPKKMRLENLKIKENVGKTMSLIDPTVRKNVSSEFSVQNRNFLVFQSHLEYRCGFCNQQLADDPQEHEEHVRSHEVLKKARNFKKSQNFLGGHHILQFLLYLCTSGRASEAFEQFS